MAIRERIPLQNRLRQPLLGLGLGALFLLTLRYGYRVPAPAGFDLAIVVVLNLTMAVFLADLTLNLIFETDRPAWFRTHVPDLLMVPAVLYALFHGMAATGGGLVIIRECFVLYRLLSRTRWFQRIPLRLQLRPTQQVAVAFAFCVVLGTYLLTIPAATTDGRGAPALDALFTSTAAVCVTALSVVDIGTYYTPFGQWVILALIQAGGLGIMTLSTAIALLFKRKLGLRTRALMQTLVEDASIRNLTTVLLTVVRATLAIEALGALILFLQWRRDFPTAGQALFASFFHAVSAFCNAGLSLFPSSLEAYRGNVPVTLTLATLAILGGLGFAVLATLVSRERFRRSARPRPRFSAHTRLALVTTAGLLVGGALFIFFFEFDGALASQGIGEKALSAFFQSVSLRTAGFYTVAPASFQNVTLWLMVLWMFVGGCPGSTAGGIKATTAGIVLLAVRSMLLGREEVEVFGRRVPREVIAKSVTILIASLLAVTAGFSLLLVSQEGSFVGLLFETVSAFANVGLSLDVTPTLGSAGKLIIVLLMYAGRIGPLVLALAVGEQAYRAPFHYPEARILVG